MHNVVVTGGSRGIGLAIATTLAAAGYRAIAIARTESEELRCAIAARDGQGGAVSFRAFDLSDIAAIAGLVGSLREEFGPLYGLVNNAGIGTSGMLTLMRDEQIEELARLNMIAPIILTKYVLRGMMVERAGRIVNIASIVGGSTGYSGLSAYAATKASLIGFTRSLAREVGQLGITVNAVAPGFVDTQMTRELGDKQREQIVRRSALRRLPGVADVAGSVEFLLSERARNITGITLTVDAGNTV
ncbi:MAG: SDR family NAD(P)-dependent oxidoreductase [Gammaproteobacteria bacterium]|nr:MAG: SDR family NAD(P)-dependent oxidoreductase [Gammaproteobacteria bacterium]TLZ34163.1 MAG: SDR family NAD(P)-dependent oxidoreductase [Gammaproteobacteria bacterium]TLZ45840.1 MAG: SDR family NAD(P)-dependent oxidoreductase [Gammaproteobacteria bacterium]